MSLARSSLTLAVLVFAVATCRRSSHATSHEHSGHDSATSLASTATSAVSTARTVVIIAQDYAFTGVPTRIRSGWITLRLVNKGRELHMFGLARVPFGHSARAVLEAVAGNRPEPESSDWGGPNAVSPGDTSTVSMYFPPGEYAIGCAVESADGRMHAAAGMMATMTVVGPPDTTLSARAADATVTLTDYHVAVQGTLSPGERTIRVQNDASRGHDLEILQLLPGHTEADAMRWFEHPAKETPTARAIGGVVAIHPGQQALVEATLPAGSYLFLCWVPDDQGHPHFLRGMHQLVTVRPPRRS